jgi:hypothetical protein
MISISMMKNVGHLAFTVCTQKKSMKWALGDIFSLILSNPVASQFQKAINIRLIYVNLCYD